MTPYYEADGVQLYLGDCLQVTEWLAADVLVTDPPYGIGWTRGLNQARGSAAHAGIVGDRDSTVRDAALNMWGSDRPAIVFGSFYALPPVGVRHVCVWEKPPDAGVVGSTIGMRRDVEAVYFLGTSWPRVPAHRGSVIRGGSTNAGGPSSIAGRTGHPHAKPGDVLEQLIAMTPDGASIADPFAGSGSILVAARNLGRRAIGVEIEERYCEVIARRLDQAVLPL